MAATPLNISIYSIYISSSSSKKHTQTVSASPPKTVSLAFLKLYELLHNSGQYHDSLLPAATSPKLLF